jgi:hypothetical protein
MADCCSRFFSYIGGGVQNFKLFLMGGGPDRRTFDAR